MPGQPIATTNKESPAALKYQNDAAITDNSNPTLAAMYPSLDALVAAAGANGVLVPLGSPGGANDRSIRARLSLGMTDAENETASEELFLVTPCEMKDSSNATTAPLLVEPIATFAWVAGTEPVVGGRTGEVFAKSVTVGGTGRLESITGVEAAKAGSDPEIVTVYDVGPATHLLRLIARGTAATVSPLGALWR